MTNSTSITWQDRWAAAPLPAVFLTFAVPYGIGMAVYSVFTDGGSLPAVLIIGTGSGLVFGLAMTYWVSRVRRRSGLADLDRGSQRSLSHFLRTGHAPDDPALHPPLKQLIAYRRRQLRTTRVTHPTVFGLLTVLSLWLALGEPFYWLLVVLFLAFLVAGPFALRRAASRLDSLDREMRP